MIGIDVARVVVLGVESNRFSSFKCDVTSDKDLEKVLVQANSLIVDVICCCGITRTGPLMGAPRSNTKSNGRQCDGRSPLRSLIL